MGNVTYSKPASSGMSEAEKKKAAKEAKRQAQLKEIEAYNKAQGRTAGTSSAPSESSLKASVTPQVDTGMTAPKDAAATAKAGTQRQQDAEEMVKKLQEKETKHPTEYFKK